MKKDTIKKINEKSKNTMYTYLNYIGVTLGIYIFFLAFGYFQESLFLYKIINTNETFSFPLFLVFLLCLGNLFISTIVLLINKHKNMSIAKKELKNTLRYSLKNNNKRKSSNDTAVFKKSFISFYLLSLRRDILYEIGLCSLTYVLAMISTSFALTQINFPTQILVKSAKCVPVIIGGFFFGKKYPLKDYVFVTIITTSLIIFNLLVPRSSYTTEQTVIGVIFLFISLFCDSMTGPRQDRLLSKVTVQSSHLMFLTNFFGTIITFLVFIAVEGLKPVYFCLNNTNILYYIFGYSISSGLGQLFIFKGLCTFGSLHLTILTTSRKLFTVIISVLFFKHKISYIQWFCVFLVFFTIYIQTMFSKKRK